MDKNKSLAETYPHLIKEWHPTKNGSLTPWDVTKGSHKEVWWQCYKGTWPDGTPADDHEWESVIKNRARNGNGCSCCNGKTAVPSNCLAETHPHLIKEWHPTKNGDKTPWDFTAGSNKKFWWQCYKGTWPDGTPADDHEWETEVWHRTKINASGCSCCCGQKVVPSNCLATTHPYLAAQWHPTKNGDLTPWDVNGRAEKVWWYCDKGTWPDGTPANDHEWQAQITNRQYHPGCPCCSGRKVVPSNCLAAKYPHLIKEWHPIKNGDLTPWIVPAGGGEKVWWYCNKGHEWPTVICCRTGKMATGCPICNESKGENRTSEYLKKNNITYDPQYIFFNGYSYQKLDFFLEQYNLAIEYNGEQHYIPVSFSSDQSKKAKKQNLIGIIERDRIKERWCKEKGINLLVIPYWDFNRIEEILDDVLLPKINPL